MNRIFQKLYNSSPKEIVNWVLVLAFAITLMPCSAVGAENAIEKMTIIQLQREKDMEDDYDWRASSPEPHQTTGNCVVVDTISAPDNDTCGLAWDNGFLWASEGGLTTTYPGVIFKIDTAGNILSSFDAPGQSSQGPHPMGLAFDGTYLWSVDFLDDKIYKLSKSGAVIGSIPAPSGIPSGLAWDGTNLWVSEWYTYKIYKLNPENGQILMSFNAPDFEEEYPFGLAWGGTHLWASTSNGIYKLDPATGAVLASCNDSAFKYGKAYGMTWDGQYLWAGGWINDSIIKIDVSAFGITDVKANNKDGPLTIDPNTPVSITVSLNPGSYASQNADWWIAAKTPFAPPGDWYTYVYPIGWKPGINLCVQTPLFALSPFEVLNMTLPIGQYLFYFAVDDNADGLPDATWLDSVEVNVQDNSAPTSVISAPLNGTTFTQGGEISFIGSGTDPEDGQLTGNSLIWTSDKDGQIGTGQSFTKSNLSVNTHTITLTAKDSDGATGTDSVTITVASTSCSDPHEPNDSFAQARYLGDSQGSGFYKELGINSYICSASDVDYFKFVVNSSVFLLYIFEAEGYYGKDYDIYLYDSSYKEIAKSATRPLSGGVNIETIDYLNPSQGTYYIKVVGYNGAYATDKTYMLAVTFASD